MRKRILGPAALMWIIYLSGCATYPPPEILSDKANNFKYQYSVDIPQGWNVSENFPQDIEYAFPQSFRKMVTLVMTNEDSKGLIALANHKRDGRLQDLLDAPEEEFHELAPMLVQETRKTAEAPRWDNEVKVKNLSTTYLNYKVRFDWFFYPCHKAEFCETVAILMCEKDKFETNCPAFESVVESLTMHDASAE